MNKNLLCGLATLLVSSTYAQKISYGAILSHHYYDLEIDGPIIANYGTGWHVGGFVEQQRSERFGLRSNLMFGQVKERGYYDLGDLNVAEINLTTIQVQALAKYDVRRTYNKGFYFIGGLRLTGMLNNSEPVMDDIYRKTHLGMMAGFGVNFAKHFGVEFIPERNLTSNVKTDAKNFGLYLNLTVNLQSMFDKEPTE